MFPNNQYRLRSYQSSSGNVDYPLVRFSNILEPEERFVPCGATVQIQDRFPIGTSTFPITGDGPNNVNRKARELLFSKFSPSELISRRVVCREWKTEINKAMDAVNHLLLFENNTSKKEYSSFIKQADFENHKLFQLKTSNSHCFSFYMVVNGIDSLLSKRTFLDRFTNIHKLTFFGTSQTWQSKLPIVLTSLMNNSPIILLLANSSNISSSTIVQNNINLFSRLSSIHFVQPDAEDEIYSINQNANASFQYAGGHFVDKTSNEMMRDFVNLKVSKTSVYLHSVPF